MIPTILIRWVAGFFGERIARPIAALILLTLLVAAGLAAKSAYDGNLIANHSNSENTRAVVINAEAHNEAANQRARDTILIADEERKRQDAIVSAPEGMPSPASIRLNCVRLRQAGYNTKDVAACR